jgi:hypothetical protein
MDLDSPGSGPRLAGLIVGGIGVAFVIAGSLVVRYSPGAIAARLERMTALPSPDGAALTDTPPGQEVLIDGRIARDQPVLFREFVAFVKEEEERDRRDRDRTEWKVRERQAPPLRIERSGDEPLRVVNGDYRMSPRTSWRDESKFIDTRYSGLVAREAVVVHGRVAPGGLEAIEVASGTRAGYLAAIEASIGTAWWLGTGFAVGGGVLIAGAIALLVTAARIRRRARGR